MWVCVVGLTYIWWKIIARCITGLVIPRSKQCLPLICQSPTDGKAENLFDFIIGWPTDELHAFSKSGETAPCQITNLTAFLNDSCEMSNFVNDFKKHWQSALVGFSQFQRPSWTEFWESIQWVSRGNLCPYLLVFNERARFWVWPTNHITPGKLSQRRHS